MAAVRLGLGCLRLPATSPQDEARAAATVAAAVGAGITLFDTAHAYDGGTGVPGTNERQLAAALRANGAAATARIVTKGGMARPQGRWAPDGRARTIRADCEASLTALDGLPIELYLLHAPDPRTPLRTSLRALARLLDEKLVRAVGVANVNRAQLDEALATIPIGAVQVACSVLDDHGLRSGVVQRCEERGITVLAHSPLGGPRRAPSLARRAALAEVATRHGCSAAAVALAWLGARSPVLVPIPGAGRPEHIVDAAAAMRVMLSEPELAAIAGGAQPRRPAAVPVRRGSAAAVHLLMGIPGAGKTRLATAAASDGAHRLNRDEQGGTLRTIAHALDAALADPTGAIRAGADPTGAIRAGWGDTPTFVLDNTYLRRADRRLVLDIAERHGAAVHCRWLDTPVREARRNLVERLLDRFGMLPSPEQLHAARREPGLLLPGALDRAVRQLEPPDADEGFASIERIAFARVPVGRTPSETGTGDGTGRDALVVAAGALAGGHGWDLVRRWAAAGDGDPDRPVLLFDWLGEHEQPSAGARRLSDLRDRLAGEVAGPVVSAHCAHGGGPPRCWCRPPLPGLPLAFARTQGVDPARCTVIGTGRAHASLAAAIDATAQLVPTA
ncbi:MAG: aldo/keto reductase [Acidimicrobiia bacterium]